MDNINNTYDGIQTQPKMSIIKAAEFLNVSIQAIHRQLKAKNLVCPKIGNKAYITHSIAKQLFKINFEHKKIVSQIVKGGTGKTTCLDNIASCVSTYGARVLLIDLDPQGNLTDARNIDPEELPVLIDVLSKDAKIEDCIVNVCDGIDMIPSRIENVVLENKISYERMNIQNLLDNLLQNVAKDYDYIMIDTPPTMGQYVAAADLYADLILVPLNPDKFSAKGLKILSQELDHLKTQFKTNINYKVFLNKFSGNTILSDKAIATVISDSQMEGKTLQTAIRYSQDIPNATDAGKNLFSTLKKSVARDDFDQLTRELFEITPNKNNFRHEQKSAVITEAS